MWFHLFGFGIGERQKRLQMLDDGLRAGGIHPHLLEEAVKLTVLRLMKSDLEGLSGGREEPLLHEAAELIAFCHLGQADFIEYHGPARAGHLGERLDAAEAAGEGRDAELILLCLTAGIAHAKVAERFEVDPGEEA